ncbi:oxygenase MpaB family protein [Salinimicrobium oceani]|uniref:DUF2236 domain-containing protein n=1 Tax=Salinimicrobium oceani TaxID=2722702 RepID=A0ABX1CZZ5_9FLAO|nr:oxygenase MpaB family protein [Salinimicrobium oceani]NJW53825.1 DUF2236 domain-containing protein [Salinimicrobium oceani]
MEYFVDKDSIVRQIWGKADSILFIFAGAAAEFALNKAVDWLYFTGRLPEDPLGRLFSTVAYARTIVFAEKEAAHRAIDQITAIHMAVEEKRGAKIPDWAYRDVLFMLIDYSIRSFELLERKLSAAEKEEVFRVFERVGSRMQLPGLPKSFDEWEIMRKEHIEHDLAAGDYTRDLYRRYKLHLGILRYKLLLEVQKLLVPNKVKFLLNFRRNSTLGPLLKLYKWSRKIKLDWIFKALLLPSNYMSEINALDQV